MFYLLPGMGASKEMYQGAWLKFPGIACINWPRHQGEASLSEVADRLIQEYGITSNDWIDGSSLGGMVAIEIYKKLKNTNYSQKVSTIMCLRCFVLPILPSLKQCVLRLRIGAVMLAT